MKKKIYKHGSLDKTEFGNYINLTNIEIITHHRRYEVHYTREIKAGRFIKRISSNIKPKGGKSIEWIWEQSSDGLEELRTNEYAVISTGEIRTSADKSEKRIANMRQIRVACEKFKWLVRANADSAQLFITLTYSENMTDTKKLYEDFRRFWQRLKRKYGINEYLVAFEPQERGAWHAHLITIGGADYIPNSDIAEIWGHGFTKTKQCQRVADLGNYLTAYLTKLDGKKGTRLSLYPARFRFLRYSRGVKQPEIRYTAGDFEELPKDKYQLVNDKTIEKELGENVPKMTIRIREYVERSTFEKYLVEKRKKKKNFFKNILTYSKKNFKLLENGITHSV